MHAFARTNLAPKRARVTLTEPLDPGEGAASAPADVRGTAPPTWFPLPMKDALAELARVRFLEGLQTATLPNGLQVVVLPRTRAPVATLKLGFRVDERDAPASLAAADAFKIDFGSFSESGGIEPEPEFRERAAHVDAFVHREELEKGLAQLFHAVRDYRVDWPSSKFARETAPRLHAREASPSVQGERLFLSAILGAHPLGHPVSLAQITAVSTAQVTDFLRRTLVPENGVLLAVGDVDAQAVFAAARRIFSTWSGSHASVVLPAPALPAPTDREATGWSAPPIVVRRPGATQTELPHGLPPPSQRRRHRRAV